MHANQERQERVFGDLVTGILICEPASQINTLILRPLICYNFAVYLIMERRSR